MPLPPSPIDSPGPINAPSSGHRLALPPGSRVGAVELLRLVGESATGLTYAAVDRSDGQALIVKEYLPPAVAGRERGANGEGTLVTPHGAEAARRFAAGREAFVAVMRTIARLRSPALPRLRHLIETNGTAIAAFEHVSGDGLDALRRAGGPPEPQDLRRILMGILEGLAALHAGGVLHRDLTPRNVVITADGSPVLVDFGNALCFGADAAAADLTALTPGFAPLEQYHAGGEEGPWTDLYSFGASALWLMTGKVPPEAPTRFGNDGKLPWPDDPTLAPLATLVMETLALAGSARPQSAAQLARRIAALDLPLDAGKLSDGAVLVVTASDDELPPTRRASRRRRPPIAAPARDESEARPKPRSTAARTAAAGASSPHRSRRLLVPLVIGAAILSALTAAAIVVIPMLGPPSRLIVAADGRGDATSIAAAVTEIAPGGTIILRPGTYAESPVIGKALTIQGDGPTYSIRIAPPAGPCLAVTGAAVRLSGISLGNREAESAAPCILVEAGSLAAEAVIVAGAAGPGVWVKSGSLTLALSSIGAASGAGVVVEAGATARLQRSEIVTPARSGIVARGALTVVDSVVRGAGEAGVLVAGSDPVAISGSSIEGSGFAGIEVRGGAKLEAVGNSVVKGRQAGIYVYDRGGGNFANNRVEANAHSGIVIGAGADPVVSANTLSGNGEHGVLALDDALGRIEDNQIEGNGGHGIALGRGARTTVADNRSAGNRDPQVQTGPAPR